MIMTCSSGQSPALIIHHTSEPLSGWNWVSVPEFQQDRFYLPSNRCWCLQERGAGRLKHLCLFPTNLPGLRRLVFIGNAGLKVKPGPCRNLSHQEQITNISTCQTNEQ